MKDKIMTAGFLYAMLTASLRFTITHLAISFLNLPDKGTFLSPENIISRDMLLR